MSTWISLPRPSEHPKAIIKLMEEKEHISVWIKRRKNAYMRLFFCMICRTGLFQYKGNIVSVIPGDTETEGEDVSKFPFIIECKGNSVKYGRCPATYVVEGYVEELSKTAILEQ
jgi:hypothetical protein